jgi:uncharacterized phage protein (TIGR02220 family)
MADFWIKIEKGTPDKPEILELAALLDINDPDTITGKMIRVWAWFDSNSESGHAPTVTKVLLDRVTGVTGFTDALVTVGWLDKTESGFCVPNFDRHLGAGAKKRASDAERKRKSREISQQCHKKSVTESVTEIGLDKSRVDKRREENKEHVNTMSASANVAFELFSYWCDAMQKNPSTSKLTTKREKAIKARLKDGYTVEQIKQAIDGCRNDPFSMGKNDRQKPFNDIELICRSGEKLESFMEAVGNERIINGQSTTGRKLSAVERQQLRIQGKYGHQPGGGLGMAENVGDIRGTLDTGEWRGAIVDVEDCPK